MQASASVERQSRETRETRAVAREEKEKKRKRDADDNLLNKYNNGIGDFLNFILAALELERDEVACTHTNTLQCAMTCSLGMYCM